MGIILSRVRKKKSTIETLEKLDKDIKEIEESGVNVQRKYKKITKLLLIYSVGLYVLCGIVFYFQFTSTIQGKLLYLVPLAISPLLLYIIRRIIAWYFDGLLNKNQRRLNEMKKEKKKILEEVMDKETYKVAKEILEKFSSEPPVPKPNYNLQLTQVNKTESQLRKRIVAPASSASKVHPPNNGMWSQTHRTVMPSSFSSRPSPAPAPPPLQLPAPILPLHRSYVDRVVEYLIGDGPNNRYALICSQCHSHNGMALKEEFEYIGFICCYCRFFNPARKVKPEAPKLDVPYRLNRESESESDSTSGENSDEDHKPPPDEKLLCISDDFHSINSDEPRTDISTTDVINEEAASTSAQVDNSQESEVQNPPEEHVNSEKPESDANCDESQVKS